MKFIFTFAAFMAFSPSGAQVAGEESFKRIPAIRTTTEIKGQSYVITRDENNRIIFVKTYSKNTIVKPILTTIEEK